MNNTSEKNKAFSKGGLYEKLNKCLFSVDYTSFVSFVFQDQDIEKEKNRNSNDLKRALARICL